MNKLLFIFLPILFLANGCATAQMQYSTKKKKAIKLYEEAIDASRDNIDMRTGRPDYEAGIELLKKALEKDDEFLEAHQLIGDFYRRSGKSKEAVYHFKRALEIRPSDNLNGLLYVDIGDLQMKNHEYDDAIKWFDKVLNRTERGVSD